jgi:hypothetical protein
MVIGRSSGSRDQYRPALLIALLDADFRVGEGRNIF